MHLVQIVTIQCMVVVVAWAADAHNMELIREMVVPPDSVVVALTIALEGGWGQPRFVQNRSPRGGRGNFNDESFIPRELFQQLSPTQRSIFLRGRDVYNSRGGGFAADSNAK
jgi:uncharacterized FlgJ-related protein